MDQRSIDAFTPELRAALFGALGVDDGRVRDLDGFESFVFAREDRDTILRVSHALHRSFADLMGEMTWLQYLAEHGAAVSAPVLQPGGEPVFAFGDFMACEFTRAPGQTITEAEWTPALFSAWGRAIGQFHALARRYRPDPRYTRIAWVEDENFDFAARIPVDQVKVLERCSAHLEAMSALPRDDTTFGLIHCDAHAGNFFYDKGMLTFFDFDDCCYCWYGYDVATILFGAVLQPWIGDTDREREAAAREFLPAFLGGYGKEAEVDALMLDQMALFLKVRELSLYAVIHAYLDVDNLEDWYTTRFMAGRQARIERDAPYLEIDYSAI